MKKTEQNVDLMGALKASLNIPDPDGTKEYAALITSTAPAFVDRAPTTSDIINDVISQLQQRYDIAEKKNINSFGEYYQGQMHAYERAIDLLNEKLRNG